VTSPEVDAGHRDEALTRRWWTVPVLRSIAVAATASSATAVLVLPVALLGGWTSWGGWLGTRGATQRLEVRVEVVDDGAFLFFPATRRQPSAPPEASRRRHWSAGSATRSPRFTWSTRWTTPPGHGSSGPATARTAGCCCPVWRWGASRAGPRCRWAAPPCESAGCARPSPGRRSPPRYLLTRDDEDDFGLLVPAGDRVAWAVPLADQAAGRLPLAGRVDLHGSVEDEGHVVPVVDGRVW